MSNFKVGKSRFSRFINGKGFYIALAICLVAIGAAAYVAANNSFNNISGIASGTSAAPGGTSVGGADWDADNSAQATNDTLSNVAASSPASSQAASSTAPQAQQPAASAAPSKPSVPATAPTIYLMPVDGSVITDYSNDKLVYDKTMDDWRVHDGVDIAANAGTPVKACADGVVLDVKADDMLGQEVIIQHGGSITSVYANLSSTVTVKKGQAVEAGDVIGAVGQTAKCEIALAPHLHFAMTKDGQNVDPLITMNKKS